MEEQEINQEVLEGVEPSIKEQLNMTGEFVLIDLSNPEHLEQFDQWVLEFTAKSLMVAGAQQVNKKG